MRIDGINGFQVTPTIERQARPVENGFGQTIKNAVSKVNELQTEADNIATKLAAGDPVDLHQAMIAMNQASTALQFTVQVRNKVIEAYQEIMRMQV